MSEEHNDNKLPGSARNDSKTSSQGVTTQTSLRGGTTKQSVNTEHQSRTLQSAPEEQATNRLPRYARNDDTKQSAPRVPALRFKEFEGEWRETTLGNLFTFKNGLNSDKEKYGSGRKFINVLDIIGNDVITNDSIIGKVEVTEKELEKNEVIYGDVLFQRSSETREEVGQANIYVDKNKSAVFGGFVIRGRKKEDYNPYFMNYLLKTSSARKEITTKSGGSTRYNVGQASLSEVFVNLTDVPEQQKIASFLSAVDEKIQQLSKKKALLEDYKKGVMQQLFSGQLRFKDENGNPYPGWEEKRLGKLCLKAQSGGTPKSTTKEYYEGEIPFLAISDMTKQGKYLTNTSKKVSQLGIDNSSSWLVPKGSLIYSMYASVGFVAINMVEMATSQAVMNMIINKGEEQEFIYYYLNEFRRIIHKYIETGTQGNINAQIVKSIKIPYPVIEEQQKIANYLSSIDTKIEAVTHQITQTQTFKKGLLQQLFV